METDSKSIPPIEKKRPRKLRVEEMQEIAKRASEKALRDADARFQQIATETVNRVVDPAAITENVRASVTGQVLRSIREGGEVARSLSRSVSQSIDTTMLVNAILDRFGGLAAFESSMQRNLSSRFGQVDEIDRVRAEIEEFIVDMLLSRPGFRDQLLDKAAEKLAARLEKAPRGSKSRAREVVPEKVEAPRAK